MGESEQEHVAPTSKPTPASSLAFFSAMSVSSNVNELRLWVAAPISRPMSKASPSS